MASRLEKKLVTCLENKEYYEAHQVYRTLYSRMLAAKKYEELMTLLFEGANKLFAVEELQSAYDLVDLFATVLLQSETKPSKDVYSRIDELLELLISHGATDDDGKRVSVDARNKFVADCVSWSQKHATKNREKKRGLSELHHHFGRVFWKKQAYEQARNHWLVAEQPHEFAKFLVDMHKILGHPGEADLFVVLAILQLICLHRVKTAETLLTTYGELHPAIKARTQPFPRPLMNFCWFLIHIIPGRKLDQFSSLVEQYEGHLQRDPSYASYLMRIGELFFGKRAPQQGGGLLGSLFKGLLGPNKKDEPEVFSDSDMEGIEAWDTSMDVDSDCSHADDEDGFETASEDDLPPPPTSNRRVIDTMDDLD